jgi:hypothetical protein
MDEHIDGGAFLDFRFLEGNSPVTVHKYYTNEVGTAMSVLMPDCSECSIIKPSHHIPHLHALPDVAVRGMTCVPDFSDHLHRDCEWTLSESLL